MSPWDVGAWIVNTIKTLIETNVIPRITHGTQIFTSDGTFTVPAGVTKILVTACGGGASGGSSYYIDHIGGIGGGGAAIVKRAFSVESGQSIAITVGKGGASVAADSKRNGNAGGSTVIGELITLPGGKAGEQGWSSTDGATGAPGGQGADFEGNSLGLHGHYDEVAYAYVLPGYGAGGLGGTTDKGSQKGGSGIVIIEW